jgi:hypothetical protein
MEQQQKKSRMMVGGLKAYYSIGRGSQAITRLAGPKEKGAREGALYRSPLQFDKERWGKQVYMLRSRHAPRHRPFLAHHGADGLASKQY